MGYLIDMIIYGFALAGIIGIIYLICWSIKRNIKMLLDKLGNKDLVDWIKDGLKKGYTEEQLSKILIDKKFKVKAILKSLIKSKRLIKKEIEQTNMRKNKVLKELERREK